MFKKSNKLNIRKRRDTDEDVAEVEDTSSNDVTKKPPANLTSDVKVKKDKSKKTKDTKKVSLLSFDDDEDDNYGALKLKKSSRSKRIVKQIKKRSQEEKEAKTTSTINAKGTVTSNSKIINAAFKPISESEGHVFQPQRGKKNGAENHAKDSAVLPALDSQLTDFNSGSIPTPSMIHAARKQREMLRKFGSEVISQEDTQKYKDKNQSRLVRDDDDDYGSSDDGIMELKGIEQKKSNTSKKYVPNESEDEINSEEEAANEDEEVNRWEEEMIKKGINLQTNQTSLSGNPNMVNIPQMMPYTAYANTFYGNQMQENHSQQIYRHVEAKTDVSFQTITKRLETHSISVKEKNRSHQAEMDRLQYDTNESEHLSKHLGDVKTISQEYQFYQEFRDYIKDLVGCLREHVPLIHNLEQNAHTLWKSQSDRLVSRRRQDVQDESSQTAPASKSTQDKGLDSQYVQRVREREARRTRRRAARQIKQSNSTHYDGFSTDDEETSMDQAQFNTGFKRIQESSDSMFDDVVDEFCDIKLILQRFSDWRKEQKNSYNDAYIALCIPKLIIPFIKLKVMLWNPLLSSTPHFEEQEWFKELSKFGLKNFSIGDEDSSSNVLDDTKVISGVIEKVLVVKLNKFIEDVWDPLSMQQTIRLSLLLKELVRDYPFMTAENSHCQKLFQSVCKRLQSAVDNDIFIPLLPSSSVDSPARVFMERQTWACIKLFKSIMLFDGLLSYKVLCEMAFDSLLNRYILLAFQMSVMDVTCLYKCQKITDSIPKSWLITYEDFSSHLSSLTRFLVHFAKSIQASDQFATKTMMKQIKTMLLVIGSREALSKV